MTQKTQTISSVGLEGVRHERKSSVCQRYLEEKISYGGVTWQRGFVLTRLQHDGQPDIILACIDDRQARERAAGRDPLEDSFFDATTLPMSDRIALYDAMGTGDMATINRLTAVAA